MGLARRVLPLGTVVWSVPHPLSAASPPCRVVLGGGGSAFRYRHPPCRPCRLPFVARMSQARRKHDASTGRGCCGGGGVSLVGPPYPPGRVLHQRPLRAHIAPASPRSSRFWSLLLAFFPWRVGLLCSLFFLFFCFVFFLHLHRSPPVSPPGTSDCPLPHPHVPSLSPRCPRPFLGWVEEKGVGGGGGGSLSVLWRKHVASTVQAPGAALVPLQGGGLAVWLPSSPFLPCVCTPGAPPAGACTARASFGHGRVVRPASSLRCLPTLPLCPRGGGGALSAPPFLHPPPSGGVGVRGGGGGLVVFPSLHACLRHDASTAQARGTALVPLHGGGGMPCGSRRRPLYPAFTPPTVPPLGLARRVPSTGTVVWSVPHPLTATSPPCRFVLGGGSLFAPPYLQPPPLGGRGCVGWGGAPMSSSLRCTHVAGTTQARRKHGVRHLAAAGGGGVLLWAFPPFSMV